MKRKNNKDTVFHRSSDKTVALAGIGILILGAGFMALGIWRGEMEVVFQKAINICMECIGIG